MSIDPKKIDKIAASSEASFLLGKMDPIFEEVQTRLIDKLKSSFRTGVSDPLQLQVTVGMLCGMDDLRNILLRKIVDGKTVEETMNGPVTMEKHPYD